MSEQTFKKILVIEEEDPVRDLFVNGLKLRELNAIGAESSRVGIEYAQQYLPDLITCSIAMSEPDGFTVLKTLRQNPATAIIPFIFVTVKTTRSDLHKAMELGANGYLIKPCTVEELVRTVTAQLERQLLLRQCYTAQPQSGAEPSAEPANLPLFPLSRSMNAYAPPLNEAFQFITTNYHRSITLADVAQAVGYSPAYLTHLMGRQTGQTVQQWIIQHRMAAACSLLLETDQPVEQIAGQVGYHHAVHFFRQFRRFYGTTPQAWRNNRR